MNDISSSYLTYVRKIPKISAAEERALFRAKKYSDIARYNLRHVISIAMLYRWYSMSMSELIAEGNHGLAVAIRKFDPECGVVFITYASYWIRAKILRYIQNNWSLVKLGGLKRERIFFGVRRERERLEKKIGAGVDVEHELQKKYGDIGRWGRIEHKDCSLDCEVFTDDDCGVTYKDELISIHESADDVISRKELHSKVQNALDVLDPRERAIVEQHTMGDVTLEKLGKRFKLSRERIRQIEDKALDKLCPLL